MTTTQTPVDALMALVDRYWELAYAEGKEGRDHDTEAGEAQAVLSEIRSSARALAAIPAAHSNADLAAKARSLAESHDSIADVRLSGSPTFVSQNLGNLARNTADTLREIAIALEAPITQQAGGVPAGWHEALKAVADDYGLPDDVEAVAGIFSELLPAFLADKEEAGYITLPLDRLIQEDSYGVWASEFYRCRICEAESGAGMLNKGIQHEGDCPLCNDARAASPSPSAVQPLSEARGVPLTDEQVRKWWASENGLEDLDMCNTEDFRTMVRAVEKKHGIVTKEIT